MKQTRSWMLPRLLDACAKPATVLQIADRMGTSLPSAATLAVRYARTGHLQIVGTRQTAPRGRPAKIYLSAKERQ